MGRALGVKAAPMAGKARTPRAFCLLLWLVIAEFPRIQSLQT